MLVPIDGPAAWKGRELAARTDWIHVLTPEEVADLERVVASARALGTSREKLTREDVAFEALAPAIASWRETLGRGRGFLLVRGVPVERMSFDEAVAAYWALGLHLGSPVPQNNPEKGTADACYRTVKIDITQSLRDFVAAGVARPSWLIRRNTNSGSGAFHYFSREGAVSILGACGTDPHYKELMPVLDVELTREPPNPIVDPVVNCAQAYPGRCS